MSEFSTFDLIRKLEGGIQPAADGYLDDKAYTNLKEWLELHQAVTDELITAADCEGLRCYGSADKIITRARQHLKDVRDELNEYLQKWGVNDE